LHRAIEADVETSGADLVFLCGHAMRALWDVLPPTRRGGYAETSSALAPALLAGLRAGDVILVKGSFGSRMSVIVDALNARDGTKPA
jgi:UDP-N-acetylmuramoyl-tripeptide--D-alanyl-D-alanine ligase